MTVEQKDSKKGKEVEIDTPPAVVITRMGYGSWFDSEGRPLSIPGRRPGVADKSGPGRKTGL